MRERMIAAADDFLADAYAAYQATERTITGDDPELLSRVPETLEIMHRADARIPRLALLFPSEAGGYGEVVESALSVTNGLRRAASAVLARVEMNDPSMEERSEAFEPVRTDLGQLMGDFSFVANEHLWKRRLRPKRTRASAASSKSGT